MAKSKSEDSFYRGKSIGNSTFNAINITLLAIITLISIVPIVNILSMSFSKSIYVASGEVFLWPKGFTIQAYKYILVNQAFYDALLVSIEKSFLGVFITMLCTILVGYPLSKTNEEFKSRKFFLYFFLITMLFNGGLIPWFMMIQYTKIYNTIWALVLPGAVQVFFILLFMNFVKGIPKEIEEAAKIDGADQFSVLFRIILPLSKAVLATIFLFLFVQHWNNWFDGFALMSDPTKYPLMTYLYTILTVPDVSHMTPDQLRQFFAVNPRSIIAAQIFVATIPVFCLYPFLQRYFTKGIVLGSVKG
jgi:putative aldouronate transport system permease protein